MPTKSGGLGRNPGKSRSNRQKIKSATSATAKKRADARLRRDAEEKRIERSKRRAPAPVPDTPEESEDVNIRYFFVTDRIAMNELSVHLLIGVNRYEP